MGDTIKEFLIFISDNPLMLFLCGAIVLLFIILIIILFAGGKKEKQTKNVKLENTAELFTAPIETQNIEKESEIKSQVGEPALVNTNPAVNNISNPLPEQTFDLEESLDDYNEEEAPININEALSLKKERETVPNIENTTSVPKQLEDTLIIPIPVELNKTASNKLESLPKKEAQPIIINDTKNEKMPEIKDFFTQTKTMEPVIPNSINDESKEIDETIDKLINEVNLLKTNQLEITNNYDKIDKMIDEVNLVKTKSYNLDPLSNAEVSYKIDSLMNDLNKFKSNNLEAELPKQNNTQRLDEINIFDSNPSSEKEITNVPDLTSSDNDLDDVELPKLKTDDTSPLKILKGESFNLD